MGKNVMCSAAGLPAAVTEFVGLHFSDELGQMAVWPPDRNKMDVRGEVLDFMRAVPTKDPALYERLDGLFGPCWFQFVQDGMNALLQDRKKKTTCGGAMRSTTFSFKSEPELSTVS